MLISCLFDYVLSEIKIKFMTNNVYVVFFKIDMLAESLLLAPVNLAVLNFFHTVIL